jgi:hypothetical protein
LLQPANAEMQSGKAPTQADATSTETFFLSPPRFLCALSALIRPCPAQMVRPCIQQRVQGLFHRRSDDFIQMRRYLSLVDLHHGTE